MHKRELHQCCLIAALQHSAQLHVRDACYEALSVYAQHRYCVYAAACTWCLELTSFVDFVALQWQASVSHCILDGREVH
jgi:hypothetical protein